ncbi:MAG: MBL fold metallo-hydrolase [Bacteroidales bacterium]|nr:MBL fold metallo-hydrolase [Bacteroidales bacterium]
MNTYVRVNGCGNAWPVFLGTEHPFYNRMVADDLGSTSYSVIGSRNKDFSIQAIEWEVVVDAGHNTVPFLLKNENRIPEALLLTHGHLDHILGADWIAQSLGFTGQQNEKLPLYATAPVWQQVLQTIPHIENAVAFTELKPGIKIPVKQVPGLSVTAFPVYHGDSARGAVMLLLEYLQNESASFVLFTGDLLFPFLRKNDYAILSKAQAIYIDCSNRFSFPSSNHISFTTEMPDKSTNHKYLEEWKRQHPVERLVNMQLQDNPDENCRMHFDSFMQENRNYENIPFSVVEFLAKTRIPQVQLVHYFGYHDVQYYRQEMLGSRALQHWATTMLQNHGMKQITVAAPKAGHLIKLK